MGRQYAAILGTIAATVVILLALLRGIELRQALAAAFVATMVFWVIGYVVGVVADWIVRDSISEEEIETLCAQASRRHGARLIDG